MAEKLRFMGDLSMVIEPDHQALDILEKVNLCNSKEPHKEQPNKLMFAKAGRAELAAMCGLIKTVRPKKIVELGVAAGGTSSVIMNAVDRLGYEADLYCIDAATTCYWDHTKEVGFVTEMANQYLKGYCKLHLMAGKTLNQVIGMIGNAIDLIILDTSHTIPGELLDYLVVFPYLADESFVIIDDLFTPLIHQLPPYNSETAHLQIAPRLLYSSVCGEKVYIKGNKSEIFQYGIKKIDKKNISQLVAISELLLLPWHSQIGLKGVKDYSEILQKHYSADVTDNFWLALKLNQKLHRGNDR